MKSDLFIMKKICMAKPFCWLPKWINPIIVGADGWNGGFGITWLGYLFQFRLPDNER